LVNLKGGYFKVMCTDNRFVYGIFEIGE